MILVKRIVQKLVGFASVIIGPGVAVALKGLPVLLLPVILAGLASWARAKSI